MNGTHIPCSKIDEPSKAKSKSRKQTGIWRLLRPSNWVEHFVFVDVARVLVVIAVTELPLVVGNHEKAVRRGTDDVIEQRVDRERAVAAVVSEHEQREEERALSCPVDDDRRRSNDDATCPKLH